MIYLKIYLYSPKIFCYLRDLEILAIHHERNIRRIFSGLSVNPIKDCDNFKYLESKIRRLPSIQRNMVHIRPTINTHLSYDTHGFDSETNDLAKTVVAFMVKSVFGPY